MMVEINSNILMSWLVNIDASVGSSPVDDNGTSFDLTSISLFSRVTVHGFITIPKSQ